MKENTFDLLTPSGAFLGLDEWESNQHCPDFEPRETYIPVVWSWQKQQQQQEEVKREIKKKNAIRKMPTKVQPVDQHEVHVEVEVARGPEWRYLFLECLHTDLRAMYPEVHQQLQDMIEHSRSYKQELAKKLKDKLDSDEQQQRVEDERKQRVEDERKLREEEEQDRKKAGSKPGTRRASMSKTARPLWVDQIAVFLDMSRAGA